MGMRKMHGLRRKRRRRAFSRRKRWQGLGFLLLFGRKKRFGENLSGSDNTGLLEVGEDPLGGGLRARGRGVDHHLGLERGFVGVVDPGESLQFAGAGLLV